VAYYNIMLYISQISVSGLLRFRINFRNCASL